MNAYEHLESGELAVESFTMGFSDGTEKVVTVYVLPSREVGENLFTASGDTGYVDTQVGCVYEIRAEVIGATTGRILPNTEADASKSLSVNGIGYWLFRADTARTLVTLNKLDGFDGTIDRVSVRKILETGDAADIKFIEVSKNSLRFSCYPAGGLLDEIDFVDTQLRNIMAVDDTFVRDEFGDNIVPMRDSQYIKFDNHNVIPAGSSFEVEIVCSFDANYEIQIQQDNTLFGSDERQDDSTNYPSFRVEAFDGYASINIPIIGQSAVNLYWPSRYIDYTKLNNFKLGRDVKRDSCFCALGS